MDQDAAPELIVGVVAVVLPKNVVKEKDNYGMGANN